MTTGDFISLAKCQFCSTLHNSAKPKQSSFKTDCKNDDLAIKKVSVKKKPFCVLWLIVNSTKDESIKKNVATANMVMMD